jgi:hypothetical protein
MITDYAVSGTDYGGQAILVLETKFFPASTLA